MICQTVKRPDGTTAIVCGRGRQKPKPCAFCGAPSTKLCDFETGRNWNGRITCDKPLCDRHAVSVGKNKDHCHDHPKPVGAQFSLEGL